MTVEAAYRFYNAITPIFGAFFDAVMATHEFVDRLNRDTVREQRGRILLPPGVGRDRSNDSIAYMVGGADGKERMIHTVPFTVFRSRNTRNGPNTVQLGNSFVITIFALWEHRYRAEIAAEIGVADADVKVSLFGDLRLVRNALAHAGGLMDVKNISRLEVIDWLDAETPIAFDEGKFIWLIERIKAFIYGADSLRPASI